MKKILAVVWKNGAGKGEVEVTNGRLAAARFTCDGGKVAGGQFACACETACRMEITIDDARVEPGANATIVAVKGGTAPFAFFLRDINKATPIYIPSLGVAVTEGNDARSYAEIEVAIRAQGLQTRLQQIEAEPEETCAQALATTRTLRCQTWLGLSRDMRIFEFGVQGLGMMWDWVKPKFHGYEVTLPEADDKGIWYGFNLGRGYSCVDDTKRRLEEGVLPIVHTTRVDEEVVYEMTSFVTLESQKLTAKNLRGTHFLVSDGHGAGHMFTKEQEEQYKALLPAEMGRKEETVFMLRGKALNPTKTPRYAYFCALAPMPVRDWALDADGYGVFTKTGRVFSIQTLGGKPMPQREVAVLLQPGESIDYEFSLPHRPISRERAAKLAAKDFSECQEDCAAFWKAKLASGTQISLPEQRVDEMTKAGLLHLDVISYGLEPNGPITANIGVYCPIGSESAPIIQFFDAMGWHKVAERALQYFLDKQHDDGFIQNFGGYMLETGPALWSMGEHYRYTADTAWVKRIQPKLLKACECMLNWRNRNKKSELRGKGYGLQDGKVADPEDPFRSFMLNGYAYLGMSRVAEMLAKVNPAESKRLAKEVKAFRKDIRDSLYSMSAKSPVLPLGDGSWVPSSPPWCEDVGLLIQFAKPGNWYTHGTITARDAMLGPVYLIFQEVLDPHEPASDWIMNWQADLMCNRNVAFSQPYYSRHPMVNLMRGEVKAFIKAFYNGFTGLADRETYTWWEHYFHASPHKTHEEGWHLLQTRWMLWMGKGDTLSFLPAIPRAWLESGKKIELQKIATYFGPASLRVESNLDQGWIEAEVEANTSRRPGVVTIRLPHPRCVKAAKATGGVYNPATETITIKDFRGRAKVRLDF